MTRVKKKKLLYVVRYALHEEFNLKMKFNGQIKAFQNMGFSTYYIGYDDKHFYLVKGDKRKVIGDTHFEIPSYIHTLFYIDMNRMVIKIMKMTDWDYVYWRAAPCWYSSYLAIKAIHKSGAKMIYEYPTYTLVKEKPLSFARGMFSHYSDIWQNKMDNLTDVFVMIGENANGSYKGKKAVNISNGICLDTIPVRNPYKDPDCIHILALASMSYWHGYDRLIQSVAEYKGNQQIIVHMVGGNDGGYLEIWKKLAHERKVDDKVLFHGPKSGEDLEHMFDLCDVGVNSLGMYRKGFSITSELKTREYAARGLPFVCSVDDLALSYTDTPLWLRVPNDDSIPDMCEIVDFAIRMRNDANCIEKLRSYASEHMTWESQYKTVFECFN